jgi:hypothetical protein
MEHVVKVGNGELIVPMFTGYMAGLLAIVDVHISEFSRFISVTVVFIRRLPAKGVKDGLDAALPGAIHGYGVSAPESLGDTGLGRKLETLAYR